MADRLKFGYFTLSDNSVGYGDYKGFGFPSADIRTRYNEELLIIRKPWTEQRGSFPDGEHHRITEPTTVEPRPTHRPHPPIYVACFSEPTMRMAAEQGFHIIFAPFAASMVFGSLANAVARFKVLAAAAGYPESTAMCSYFTCMADTVFEKPAAQERLF